MTINDSPESTKVQQKKPAPRVRHWCFTSYTPISSLRTIDIDAQKIRYLVCNPEGCPKTGKEHLQGYVEFYDQLRRKQAQKRLGLLTAHMEPRKGTREQAANYCKKEESRLPGTTFLELGNFGTEQGARTDLQQMVDCIIETPDEYTVWRKTPELYLKFGNNARHAIAMEQSKQVGKYKKVEVAVIHGDTRTGKTRHVYDKHGSENVYTPIYSQSAGKFWFDGYAGQDVLLINEFYGQARTSVMQNLLDNYRLRLEIKGGTCVSNWSKIYITSNCHPKEWYSHWESIPKKVEESFIERISYCVHKTRPPSKIVKQWSDIPEGSGGDASITPPTSDPDPLAAFIKRSAASKQPQVKRPSKKKRRSQNGKANSGNRKKDSSPSRCHATGAKENVLSTRIRRVSHS